MARESGVVAVFLSTTSRNIEWRVAGVVELGSLENCCAGDRTVGSNPTLSAILTDLVMLSGDVAAPYTCNPL